MTTTFSPQHPTESYREGETHVQRPPRTARAVSWLIGAAGVTTTSILFALFVPDLWHWMIVPTSVAGVLVAVDVIEWLRGRMDLLQPRAVVALFALHLCYVGPLLHVTWDNWPKFVQPASDWRTSLGLLGLVNVAGLLIYRMVMAFEEAPLPTRNQGLSTRRFVILGACAVFIGLIGLGAVVVKFGGPAGYLRVISGNRESLAGNGWLLIIAESWPLLLFAVVLLPHRSWFRTHLVPLALLLLIFVLVQFVTGGLRGSRGNTVWPTIMAIGMVHLLVRPVRRKVLLAGALTLVAFMYLYGFYKSVGADVVTLAERQTTTAALADQTGRTLPLLLLEDFGRAGTQSIVIDRIGRGGELSWGMTYVGDLVKLTPDSVVPDPPKDKSEAGTDMLYASGSYDAGIRSSRIFGLAGEGMLNFGLAGGALAFLPFALFVRWGDRVWRAAALNDDLLLKLIAPSLSALAVLALGSDFDNVLWLLYAQILPLALVLLLARRSPAAQHRAGGR